MVKVYYLHSSSENNSQVSVCLKAEDAPFQAPGCSLPFLNGVVVPAFFKDPITSAELNPRYMIHWDLVKSDIVRKVCGHADDPESHQTDVDMRVTRSQSVVTQLINTCGDDDSESRLYDNESCDLDE